jgi:sigma-54 dependent transcriptional regulator, acetoin dehydrogenase operon transcriptional activator AcoR
MWRTRPFLYHEARHHGARRLVAAQRSHTRLETRVTRRPSVTVKPPEAARADTIAQAHARSLALGLRASEAPDFQPLGGADLRDLLDANHTLYHQARPVMDALHAQIVDTESMVLLTDRNGVILHSLGDTDFVEKARRVALRPGVSWAERDRGTNAIGTALVDAQPTIVHAGEHFLRANHILTCSCAPIADPWGRTLGALDVSGESRGFHKHTLALVRMSAQCGCNFTRARNSSARSTKASPRSRRTARCSARTAARCSSSARRSPRCNRAASTRCSASPSPPSCSS